MHIIIERSVSAAVFQQIVTHVESEIAYEPRLNGAKVQIERGDFTTIEDDDSNEATRLFREIVEIIHGEA